MNTLRLMRSIYQYEADNREPGIGKGGIRNRESETRHRFSCFLFEKTSRIILNCKNGNRESGTGNRELVPYFGI